MSVEARELMVDVWTRWQGQLVDGKFPLGRFLGSSEHSGVFLTRLETRPRGDVAIKLIPIDLASEELQAPRWNRAGALVQPHLLPLFEWGGCQLDGLPYLYIVMEYADQTLGQILLHRALTSEETREMLLPILDALAFLHGQDRVHGQLKPANIMVVGDQLKLASDTIRGMGEGELRLYTPTVYDPPEGGSSAAGDIWALGVNLYEALTGRPPPNFREHRGVAVLPPDFSPAFRDLVARCLSSNPHDRPSVTELLVWAHGPSTPTLPRATLEGTKPENSESSAPKPAQTRTVASSDGSPAARPAVRSPGTRKPPIWLLVMVASVMIFALGWTAVHMFTGHRTQDATVASTAADMPAPDSAMHAAHPVATDDLTAPLALHDEIPEVPHSASRTIHGHIKVSIRATVDPDGSVSTVLADRPGSSRYFRRLAAEAAKGWRFRPSEATAHRVIQIQFDFSRDGTTGKAVLLR